jgi:CRP/FNR family transcriptional regulator, cyclic AMP receptor protein
VAERASPVIRRRHAASQRKVAAMLIVEPSQVLENVSGFPLRAFERGDIVLSEGSNTHRLLFLNRGAVDVVKDEVELTRVTEPGAVFGDISVLLGQPHTADVLAAEPSSFYIVDQADEFLRREPLVALYVATVLARRLNEVNRHLIEAWGRAAAPEQRRRFFVETLRKMAGALQIGVPRFRQAEPPTPSRPTPAD